MNDRGSGEVARRRMVGGESAYNGQRPPGFMFGLKQGGGLVVWERVPSREDRQWGEVPPMPEAEAELRKAFAAAMAKAPKGAVPRYGARVGEPTVLISPNGRVRVDAGLPGSVKEHYYADSRLSRAVCDALMDLWRVPLVVSEVPGSLPATFQAPIPSEEPVGGGEPLPAPKRPTSHFQYEFDMLHYLVAHWGELPFSSSLEIVRPEYPTTDGGRIDILCKNKDGSGYTAIELKRGQTGYAVLGQVQTYMAYVRGNLVKEGQSVRGIIICGYLDERLVSAAKEAPNVEVYTYSIQVGFSKRN